MIGFSQTDLFVSEGDGTLSLMIVKDGDSEIDIQVEVLLEDVSATGMLNSIFRYTEDQVWFAFLCS